VSRRVQTPDGVIHEFPDDATDKEIAAALDSVVPKTKPRTNLDRLVDALPMVGGMVGGALGAATGIPTLGMASAPAAIAGAGVLGAGGEAARELINRARGADAPPTAGQAAKDIGVQGAVQGGMEAVGQGVTAAVTPVAKAVYRGYLKPSLSKINIGKAKEIVDTAFRENLPVTAGAVDEAGRRISALKTQVDDLLANTPGMVDLHQVAEKVRAFARQTFSRPGRGTDDLQAALDVADRIDAHPSMTPTPPNAWNDLVDLSSANQVKRDLQEGVGPSQYGIKSKAGTTAEKMGAREMRTTIEGLAPDVGPLNARESRLIDLARSMRQAVGREENRNALFGVPSLMSGLAGGEEYQRTRDPYQAAATALATRIGLHPAVATRAALLAARMAEQVPGTVVSDVARAAVQAVLEAQKQP
jgi:hypothetical protein